MEFLFSRVSVFHVYYLCADMPGGGVQTYIVSSNT